MALHKIEDLDLEPIMVKVMDKEEGLGWSLEFANRVVSEYKRFLTLCLENPDFPMVPSKLVDEFWHYHILDTQKYHDDCDTTLGHFLHHFPYFGMRGEQDAENLKDAWQKSCALYEQRFGEIDREIWSSSNRCPNCGRISKTQEHGYFIEGRPKLKKAA